MKKKKNRRRKKRLLKAMKITVISFLMVFAAVSGIYCAKIYTTPYSSIVNEFHSDTLLEVEISKDKCNILILGTDKSGLLTDVMMLAQIDPDKDKAVVMSIPRDTYVKYGSRMMKINEVHSIGQRKNKRGSETSIVMVKELTGIPINHFVKVNFDAFSECIDALGGVDFDVPQRMRYRDPYQDLDINLQKGFQHLDGEKAEDLVRFRRYPNGDIDRIKVQQNFIHALAEQKLKAKYIGKIPEIYKIIMDNMETSMTPDDLIQCGRQLITIGTEHIETITLPHTMVQNASYVKPLYDEIGNVRETVFGYDEEGNDI